MNSQPETIAKERRYPVHLFAEAITYRIPKPVTKMIVYARNNIYPICPRCFMSLEREYMFFCDRCGQKLNWDLFEHAKICHPEYKRE